MKLCKQMLPIVAIGALVACAVPAFSEDEGLGEYVRDAAQKFEKNEIAPGQFAMVARSADAFLSAPPGDSGAFMLKR